MSMQQPEGGDRSPGSASTAKTGAALSNWLPSRRIVLGLSSFSALLLTYSVVSNLPGANHVITPPPQEILTTLVEGIADASLLSAIAASLTRVLTGYVLGCAAAIALGVLMGWFRTFEYLVDPIVEAVRPIPPLAYIPLVIIWVGIDETSRILVIFLASFLTCIVSTITGIKQVPRVFVEAAQTLGAGQIRLFLTIAIPSALPYIFAGLRVALAASWTTLVAAELVAAQDGLGWLLQNGRRFLRTDLVMVGVIVIGVLAFSMDRGLRYLQRRLTRWADVR
jgi:ABC-type nitrate/sulfonate/bicarbonate transport system permease component